MAQEEAALVAEGAAGWRPLSWYKELSAGERRAFWACFWGWGLDGMDVKFFGLVIPTLLAAWGISKAQIGFVLTATLLSSAVGGWAGGLLADRFGRVRMLQASILWFSAFTFVTALTDGYAQLLTVRILYGLGFGAEWGVGAALVGEIIRDKYRATAGGSVHSAWSVGGAIAAGLCAGVFAVLPPQIAWRALFALGVLPALFIFWIRRHVADSPIWVASRRQRAAAVDSPGILAIFAPELLPGTVLGATIALGCLGGGYAVQTWLPTYLNTVRHLSVVDTSGFIVMFEVAHFCGFVSGAYLADLIGRRLNFVLMAAATAITVAAYMFLPVGNTVTFLLGIPLGFFSSGTYGGVPAILNEAFPTRVRGSGVGFCFNFGRGIAAIFPLLIGVLSAVMPLGATIGLFSLVAYGLVVLGALLLPETRGRALIA